MNLGTLGTLEEIKPLSYYFDKSSWERIGGSEADFAERDISKLNAEQLEKAKELQAELSHS